MFGGRRRRVERLSAGAAKSLEPGEAIHELVQTQVGQAAAANATAVASAEFVSAQAGTLYGAKVRAAPHVLVATDRNLYAMTLSGARLLDVGDVVLKVPLDQVELRHEKNRLIFGGVTFHVMGLFGERAKRLVEYVTQELQIGHDKRGRRS
jgi:hypothetical protein